MQNDKIIGKLFEEKLWDRFREKLIQYGKKNCIMESDYMDDDLKELLNL